MNKSTTHTTSLVSDAIGPWEAMLALVKAADEAAEWITATRRGAESQGDMDVLSVGRRDARSIAPGQRGAPEVKKLRAAIRKAREAMKAKEEASPADEVERQQSKLRDIADRITRQADCLDKYAEQSGYKPEPIGSVFHLQSSHFRDLANELREAIRNGDEGMGK